MTGTLWLIMTTLPFSVLGGLLPVVPDKDFEFVTGAIFNIIEQRTSVNTLAISSEDSRPEYVDALLRSPRLPPVILLPTLYTIQTNRSDCIVTFNKTFDVINLPKFLKHQYVTIITVCADPDNTSDVNPLRLLDSVNLLGAYQVSKVNGQWTVLTYDRFRGYFVQVGWNASDIFYDKARDVHGYNLTCLNRHYPPHSTQVDGIHVGRDARMAQVICRKVNATFNAIVSKMKELKLISLLSIKQADFSTNHFIMPTTFNSNVLFQWTRGTQLHKVCFIVPRAHDTILVTLGHVFDKISWCLIGSGFILLLLLFYSILPRKKFGFVHVFFVVLELHVFATTRNLLMRSLGLRFAYLFLGTAFIYCTTITIIFGSQFTAHLIVPQAVRNVDTLEEVFQLNLTMFVSTQIIYQYMDVMRKLKVNNRIHQWETFDRLIKDMNENGTKIGLMDTEESLAYVLRSPFNRLASGHSRFHVVKECLPQIYTTSFLQYFSPFEEQINEARLHVLENGLYKFWELNDNDNAYFLPGGIFEDEIGKTNKFRNIFIFLASGLFLSVVEFIFECIVGYLKRWNLL